MSDSVFLKQFWPMFGVIASASHRSHWSQKLLLKTDGPTKRQARGSRNFNITTGNGQNEKEHLREVKDLVLHNNLLGDHWWNPNGWWSCSEKQLAQCEGTLARVLFSLTLPFRLLPSLHPLTCLLPLSAYFPRRLCICASWEMCQTENVSGLLAWVHPSMDYKDYFRIWRFGLILSHFIKLILMYLFNNVIFLHVSNTSWWIE